MKRVVPNLKLPYPCFPSRFFHSLICSSSRSFCFAERFFAFALSITFWMGVFGILGCLGIAGVSLAAPSPQSPPSRAVGLNLRAEIASFLGGPRRRGHPPRRIAKSRAESFPRNECRIAVERSSAQARITLRGCSDRQTG